MIAALPLAGIGNAIAADRNNVSDVADLKSACGSSNKMLLSRLNEDAESAKLVSITQADAKLERMTRPVLASAMDLSALLLHFRFCVVQTRPNGSVKPRAVDNFSWSASGGFCVFILSFASLVRARAAEAR